MWLTALTMGLAGSLHCLGMCSPLAMAVTNLRSPYFFNRLVYNGGRILCYGLLGAFFSTFGSLFRLSGLQNVITISLGCILIIIAVAGTRYVKIPFLSDLIYRLSLSIKNHFSTLLKSKSIVSIGLLGVLNGLLPCGLTYLALTYCLTVGDTMTGFTFMLVFGAGTLPVMLGLTSVLQQLVNRFSFQARHLTTVVMIVLGVLLISRGAFVVYHEPAEEEAIVICK